MSPSDLSERKVTLFHHRDGPQGCGLFSKPNPNLEIHNENEIGTHP